MTKITVENNKQRHLQTLFDCGKEDENKREWANER